MVICVSLIRELADHTMGLITLLRNALGMYRGDPHVESNGPRITRIPKIEIFGPRGIRHFVRTIFTLTHTRSADQYCVHELLLSGEEPSTPGDATEHFHPSEEAGQDIHCDERGFWRRIVEQNLHGGKGCVVVDAGPIVHRG
jgi:ribonuclease Z